MNTVYSIENPGAVKDYQPANGQQYGKPGMNSGLQLGVQYSNLRL